MAQEKWTKWIGAITFAINANVNRTTGFTPFYLMFGREPNIPLHTIVRLPQPEALEPQDFVRTHMLAMTRDLLWVRENYYVYYRHTVATYKAKSPIGDLPHLNKSVWAWLPYHKVGPSGALSAKWTGPWRVVRFSPPALLVIQTTWLGITGRKEICREIVIDKLKLFQQPQRTSVRTRRNPGRRPGRRRRRAYSRSARK